MLPIPQIELNTAQAYLRHTEEKFAKNDYLAGRYILVLKILEWQLKRKLLKKPATLESLQTLKTGHREAERFLFDIAGGSQKESVREINSILQLIALEFHAEIVQIESQFPHMRAEFARERAEYRLMWNHYVRDADESRNEKT